MRSGQKMVKSLKEVILLKTSSKVLSKPGMKMELVNVIFSTKMDSLMENKKNITKIAKLKKSLTLKMEKKMAMFKSGMKMDS